MNDVVPASKGREIALGLGFFLVATIVSLGVGEGAMRAVAARRLIYNIEMVKYAKALKVRDPVGLVSHVHRPSASAQLMGVEIALNALGDRGPELRDPKERNHKRVLVLGSSITLGWGVPFDSVFTARTERMLNTRKPFGSEASFEFVNAGIGNYNTAFQYLLFQKQYPLVKPDLVVLNYFISDAQPRSMGRDSFILKHSYLAAFLFDRWSQAKLRFNDEYKGLFAFYDGLYADSSSAWKLTQQQILAMRDATGRGGVPFVVLITPDIHDLSPGSPYKALYAKMEMTFTGMGLATLNTFDRFQHEFGDDVSKLWIQSDDPHPNARGHALSAEILYQMLVATDPLRLGAAGHLTAAR